ncbi:MAG: hypothetical protein ACM3MK_07410 [Chitinophagales bacterium]
MIRGLILLLFNLVFALFVWLMMYFPGWDIMASLLYVGFICWEARVLKLSGLKTKQIFGIALVAQLPGLILEALAIWYWYRYGPVTSDFDFVLQMWNTPFVPLISLFAWPRVFNVALGYLGIYLCSPFYILAMTGWGYLSRRPTQ